MAADCYYVVSNFSVLNFQLSKSFQNLIQWNLFKVTTKCCGLSRQENKRDVVKTVPGKWWNLHVLSKTFSVSWYRFHCIMILIPVTCFIIFPVIYTSSCSWWIMWGVSVIKNLGDHISTKMPSYQFRDPHDKDKTVSRPSYLYHGYSHTWKDSLFYIEMGSRWLSLSSSVHALWWLLMPWWYQQLLWSCNWGILTSGLERDFLSMLLTSVAYMGQVTKVRLPCYLVLLSFDCKTR